MNRLGFMPERVHTVWQQLRAISVGEMTLMSHFAEAEPAGIVEPMRRIEQAAEGLDCPRSLANSAATLWHPEAHFDWVRPGHRAGRVAFRAVAGHRQHRAEAGRDAAQRNIGVQNLRPGEAIGYGGLYRTTRSSGSASSPAAMPMAIRGWRRAAPVRWMAYAPPPWDAYRWICWRSI